MGAISSNVPFTIYMDYKKQHYQYRNTKHVDMLLFNFTHDQDQIHYLTMIKYTTLQ